MTGKKTLAGILSVVSAFILIMVILLTSIEYGSFNLDFFRQEYQKMDTARSIGMSEDDLMRTTGELLDYIKGERDDLDIRAVIKGEDRQVFNRREIRHMVDVRALFSLGKQLRNTGIVLLLLLLVAVRVLTGKSYYRYWAGGYLAAVGMVTLFLVAVLLSISRDFLGFWDSIHRMIFSNDLWMLDPQTDILIQMVPEQFFFDLTVNILAVFSAVIMVLAVAAGGTILMFIKKGRINNG